MAKIQGVKLAGRDSNRLAYELASVLGIQPREVSRGQRIATAYLRDVYLALTDERADDDDLFTIAAAALESADLTYQPGWDTNEGRERERRPRLEARALSRLLTAISGTPRCFILNVTDSERGAAWETDHESTYRFDDHVTGRVPLLSAGPGSRVIYYSTGRSRANKQQFIAAAHVHGIEGDWDGPWTARLNGYTEFPVGVPWADLDLPGANWQHAITEISFDTYSALMRAGGIVAGDVELGAIESQSAVGDEDGSDFIARVRQALREDESDLDIEVPEHLTQGVLLSGPAKVISYRETETSADPEDKVLAPKRTQNRARDKEAELLAVDLVTRAFERQGWVMSADRQRDGIGYDLEFERGGRVLKVEVKGIQGSQLVFNLTPKELWRAETDPDWLLVAATGVLSARTRKLHVLGRERIVGAEKAVQSFRVRL
ncbi:protein NO VEIN domain-containing protein [Demequina sp. NBRC 110054]|uniref:protein NO VEIN domain-containing protein n=1 Tax=Demequina sp. NBRC 110054 TaxID=1570343 RepID=UPI000A054B14|nr:DUF3883 domain-containing protein [Demequina sp. NBRC 110054]